MIKNVTIEPVAKVYLLGIGICAPGNVERYNLGLVKQVISIEMKSAMKMRGGRKKKSGKTYQIAMKDADRVKEEIEKRIITINNKTSVS